jgi:hypothetical protein
VKANTSFGSFYFSRGIFLLGFFVDWQHSFLKSIFFHNKLFWSHLFQMESRTVYRFYER